MYHKGGGKKGANNVALLIVKTLQQLNLLCEDSVGGELNVIFNNLLGQNKNNTVLSLAAWLMSVGYFKEVNFVFLIVGHTKNAADRLFNSLKNEYRKQNLFTFQDLVETLNKSLMVTIHPENPDDFLDYNKLMSSLFWTLSGNIKKNHIFSCNNNKSQMTLRHSNLPEHQEFVFYPWKKGTWDGMTRSNIAEHSESVLVPITCPGMNPYIIVEMWKKLQAKHSY